MLQYKDESTIFPNKSIVGLTLGLMGVLIGLANSKLNFLTRFLAYLDCMHPMNESIPSWAIKLRCRDLDQKGPYRRLEKA